MFMPWLTSPWAGVKWIPVVGGDEWGETTDIGVGVRMTAEELEDVWGWVSVKGKDTNSKDFSSNVGSWKWMDEGDDSPSEKMSFLETFLDEKVRELLPGASSVTSGVSTIFDFWLLFETSFLGSDKIGTLCWEVSDLVWGFLGARAILKQKQLIISSSLNNQRKCKINPGKIFESLSPTMMPINVVP